MILTRLKSRRVIRVRSECQFKYDTSLMMLVTAVFIMCDTTAFRQVVFLGTEVPLSGLILPIVFALSDVVTEVYGYSTFKKLIKGIIFCQLFYSFGIHYVVNLPSPVGNISNWHYQEAFKHIVWTSLASCFSIPTGMYINSIILSLLKHKYNGRHLLLRALVAGTLGELVICCVAYNLLFMWEHIGYTQILNIILKVWIYRLIFTAITMPFFVMVARGLKYLEGKEVYDYDLSYNPFKPQFDKYEDVLTANDASYSYGKEH